MIRKRFLTRGADQGATHSADRSAILRLVPSSRLTGRGERRRVFKFCRVGTSTALNMLFESLMREVSAARSRFLFPRFQKVCPGQAELCGLPCPAALCVGDSRGVGRGAVRI